MSKIEDCTYYKEALEIADLLSKLTEKQRSKAHGIIIGMELAAREVQNDKKIS